MNSLFGSANTTGNYETSTDADDELLVLLLAATCCT
jgi:uncharacterized protein with ATP-grasp and redox domains